MYIKINNQKIEIKEYTKFIDRFKSLKFILDKVDYGIKLPNKRRATTTFFCQRVDICFTDKNDKIMYLYKDVKSEKRIIKIRARNIYYLPLNTAKHLKIGEKFPLKK